jgi:CRISPR-associated Csx2 family protein
MAKILISPLGVGGRSKDGNSPEREYQEANYRIGGKDYQSRFIASALYKHFQLDGIIFIGTVKSMWEEVYRFFCESKNQPFDAGYWLDLATKIDSLNHQSNLEELELSSIKNLLGNRSECILIKYGLDEEELWQNLDQVFQVVNLLKCGDEIYIDITHSFRSLSLFLFLILTFLKDLPQTEDIKISGVYYGMLDISREMGYTPVIDLKSLFNMTDWIKASYILNHYGDGNLVASLLKEQGEAQVADKICNLSSSININYLPAIRQNVRPLNSTLSNSGSVTQ